MSQITETVSQLGAKVTDMTENVADYTRAAGTKLEDGRNQVAGALHHAASSVRTKGRQTSNRLENMTTGVADALDATGRFVEESDLKTIGEKTRRFLGVRRAGVVMAAVGIGFVAGFAVRQIIHSLLTSDRGY